MIERVKSVVLTILILTSLVLSGVLWYGSPNVEEMNRNDYIPQQLIGESRQLEDLVKPRSVVYHSGDGRHFMSFSGDAVYDSITASMPEWQVTRLEEKVMTTSEWKSFLNGYRSLELRFPVSIPTALFAERLSPGMEPGERLTEIDRIWVYRLQNEWNVLLISDVENRMYEGKLILDSGEDVFEQVSELGPLRVTPVMERIVSANPYEPIRMKIHYFPEGEMSMPEWEASLEEIDLEQLKNLLFLDPSLVRTVTDAEEGAVVMQDGSRTVRYVEANRMIYYQNYKVKLDVTPIVQDFHDAVQFVNHHGGWMADHYLANLDEAKNGDKGNRYEFRLMKDGLPVYAQGDDDWRGTLLTVESKGGHVLRYDRSLHFASEEEYIASRPVVNGMFDLERLTTEFDMADVRDMFPAYRVTREDGVLRYVPGWRIQFANGDETWFEPSADGGGEADGLE